MTISISKNYKECAFRVGALSSAVKKYLDFFGGDLSVEITAGYSFPGGITKTRKMDFSELDSITRLDSELESVTFSYMEGYEIRCIILVCRSYKSLGLSLRTESVDDANKGVEIFSDYLSLVEKNEVIDGEDLYPKGEGDNNGEVGSLLEYPDRVTLKWLYHNVPYKFWFWLAFLLVTVFGLGVYFAKTPAYDLFQNL